MTYKKRGSHSEDWWAKAPPTTLRCTAHYKSTGERCRHEASPGTSVCNTHGALTPATVKAAAVRVQMSADAAARSLVEWMNNPDVEMRERVKIAQDLLDRSSVSGVNKVLLGVTTDDPVETLFRDVLADPAGLGTVTAEQTPTPPVYDDEGYVLAELLGPAKDEPEDVVDAELVEDRPVARPQPNGRRRAAARSGEPKTPAHIREALDRLL